MTKHDKQAPKALSPQNKDRQFSKPISKVFPDLYARKYFKLSDTIHVPRNLSLLFIVFYAAIGMLAGKVFVNAISSDTPVTATNQFVAQIQIQKTEESPGYKPMTAPEGEKFLILTAKLSNNSESPFDFAPVLQTYVTDTDGHRFEMTPTVLASPIEAGHLLPGETREGQISYLVPATEENFTFHFDRNK